MERSTAVEMLLAPLAVVATASVVDESHNRHVSCQPVADILGARAAAGGEGGGWRRRQP